MKTLILYATKYGAAGEIARRIAVRSKGAETRDLRQGDINSLAEYDHIIVGSSIYVGMIRKEAKAFFAKHADDLRGKTLGLFLSGMNAGEEEAVFKANVPQEVLQEAKAVSFLGGIFDPKKAKFMERFIMKVAAKQSGYKDSIDDEKIEQFVEAMGL